MNIHFWLSFPIRLPQHHSEIMKDVFAHCPPNYIELEAQLANWRVFVSFIFWGPKSEVAQALSRLRDPKVLGCLRIRVLETQYGWAKAKVANFRSIGLGDASTKKVRCLERHVNFTMKFWPKGKYVWWNRHHVFGGWNVGGRKSDHNNLLWFKLWGPKQNCHTSLR